MTKKEILNNLEIIGYDIRKDQTIDNAFQDAIKNIKNRDVNEIKTIINAYKFLKTEKDIYIIIEKIRKEYQLILKCLKDIKYDKDIHGSVEEAYCAYNSCNLSPDEIEKGMDAFNFLITVDSDYIDKIFMENEEMFEYENDQFIGERNEIIVFNSNGEKSAKIKDGKTGDYIDINMPPIIENLGNCFLTKKGIYNLVGKKIFGKYNSVKKVTNNILEIIDSNYNLIYLRISDLQVINTKELSKKCVENLKVIFNYDPSNYDIHSHKRLVYRYYSHNFINGGKLVENGSEVIYMSDEEIKTCIDIDDETKDQIFNYIILGNKLKYLECDISYITKEVVLYKDNETGFDNFANIDGECILENKIDYIKSNLCYNATVIAFKCSNNSNKQSFFKSFIIDNYALFDFKTKEYFKLPDHIKYVSQFIDGKFLLGLQTIDNETYRIFLTVKNDNTFNTYYLSTIKNNNKDFDEHLFEKHKVFDQDIIDSFWYIFNLMFIKISEGEYILFFDNFFNYEQHNMVSSPIVHIKNIFSNPKIKFLKAWPINNLSKCSSISMCAALDNIYYFIDFSSKRILPYNPSKLCSGKFYKHCEEKNPELSKNSNYIDLNINDLNSNLVWPLCSEIPYCDFWSKVEGDGDLYEPGKGVEKILEREKYKVVRNYSGSIFTGFDIEYYEKDPEIRNKKAELREFYVNQQKDGNLIVNDNILYKRSDVYFDYTFDKIDCDFMAIKNRKYLINLRDELVFDLNEKNFYLMKIDRLGNMLVKYGENHLQNYMLDCKGNYLFGPFDEVIGPSDDGIYVVTVNNMKYCYLDGKLISNGAENAEIERKYIVDKNGVLIDSEDVICYSNNGILYGVDKDGDKIIKENNLSKEENKVKKLKS